MRLFDQLSQGKQCGSISNRGRVASTFTAKSEVPIKIFD